MVLAIRLVLHNLWIVWLNNSKGICFVLQSKCTLYSDNKILKHQVQHQQFCFIGQSFYLFFICTFTNQHLIYQKNKKWICFYRKINKHFKAFHIPPTWCKIKESVQEAPYYSSQRHGSQRTLKETIEPELDIWKRTF